MAFRHLDPNEVREDRITACMTAYGVAAVMTIQTLKRKPAKVESTPTAPEGEPKVDLQGVAGR